MGSDLLDLSKINFIYGANGSGKTTISNFIAEPTLSIFSDCSIVWENDQPLEALVYNKNFREKNFGQEIDGIFTIGSATKEDLELIEKKKKDLEEIEEEGKKTSKTLDKLKRDLASEQEDFKKWCWANVYKRYEKNFKEAFAGNIGSKKAFMDKLIIEYKNNSAPLLTMEDIHEKAKTIFGNTPKNLPFIYNIEFHEIDNIESNAIWQTKIIGKNDVDIANLIDKLNISDWVNQGRQYLQEGSNICPFCQQETITEEFKKKLEDYFDETYIKSVDLIKNLIEQYRSNYHEIINYLEKLIDAHKNNPESKLSVNDLIASLEIIKSKYQSNMQSMHNKLKEPSRNIEIEKTTIELKKIQSIIDKANEDIKKHNELVSNFKNEKKKLIKQIWKFIVEDTKEEINKRLKKIDGLKKGISNIEKDLEKKRKEWELLKSEIIELNKNVTSIQPTIDEINRLLSFYGFTNFQIVPSSDNPNKYQIRRDDGTIANNTLSEGEVTFVTFLYYYQLTKGSKNKKDISNNRILVIDDPISSLDSNILFVVSSLVKELISKVRNGVDGIKQIIILTHNVYFHKEISFIDSRTTERNDTEYWIIRKSNNISKIYSYGRSNPIKTSYQLLWQELIERGESSLATIQNIMRRIIENYFKILGDYRDDGIIDKFDTQEERIICRSLISWINDGSHSVHDDLYIELPDMQVETYMSVFEKIFEYTGHSGHYKMMMKIEETN